MGVTGVDLTGVGAVPDWKVEESDVKDIDAVLIGRYTVALPKRCGRHSIYGEPRPPEDMDHDDAGDGLPRRVHENDVAADSRRRYQDA